VGRVVVGVWQGAPITGIGISNATHSAREIRLTYACATLVHRVWYAQEVVEGGSCFDGSAARKDEGRLFVVMGPRTGKAGSRTWPKER
jgi:hypothetical protein